MSIEEIKQRVENYKSEYLPYFNNNGEMEEWNSMFKDVQSLLEQNQRLREERDSFQRVGIKGQEVNVQLVEALEKCLMLGECQLDYGGSMDALEQVAGTAFKALQAYKLLEKKD